jgi:leader peptidase (prepilin peptidase)/N-methyltransferase
MAEAWVWPALLGVLGLVFGSFIATVAVRWPAGRSIADGRSRCDACGDELSGFELVPVLSYAVLLGRCASCRTAIKPSHSVIELIAGAIGVIAGLAAPGIEGVAGAVFGWLLLALAALDLAAFWLPDILTGALAATGLIAGLWLEPTMAERIIGGAGGFLGLWLVAAGYRVLRGRDGLGGGDPKLFGGIGLWLGWQALPMVLLVASLAGLAGVFALRLGGRAMGMQDRVPLGVALAASAWAVWLIGGLVLHA